MHLVPWFARSAFWDFFAWFKMAGVKPLNIPLPPAVKRPIRPVPVGQAIPEVPLKVVLTCPPGEIPADERSALKSKIYQVQVWLYSHFSPMQPGLPPIDADPDKALKRAYTRPRRSKLAPPVLPAEYLGSPDLGALAVRGPYACYTTRRADGLDGLDGPGGLYAWDLMSMAQYPTQPGLQTLGATVLFSVDANQRALRAIQIDTVLGSSRPGDGGWELAKKIALCTATTHLSLVRHFNGVHLIGGSYLAMVTRNQLPSTHPLCRLLWPYIYATMQSNDTVTRGQMVRGGDFETTFSLSFEAMCRLFDDSHADYDLIVNDPQEDGLARGILDAGFDTPTQDNLQALFDPLHRHARRYLQLYYPETTPGAATDAIRQDVSIGAWLDELNTLVPRGVAVTRATVDFDRLARLLARFMYLVSVQHEILGSYVWNYQLWTHRQPIRIRVDGQREPLDVYQRLVNANYNLCVHRRELIYDFSYLVDDMPGKAECHALSRELNALQQEMERQPWAVWRLYPQALKVNINA